MMDPATRPAVASMYRLQFEPAQDAWVLLYPEGMVRLNTPAAEILRRCDGARSVGEIVGELELAFARTALHDDVNAFLAQARERGWLDDRQATP
jgi:pyrroloquinoline quinone biosynthesis protein D